MPCPHHPAPGFSPSLGGDGAACPPESPAYVPSPKSLEILRSESFLANTCKEIEAGASPHVAAQVQGMKEDDYWHFWYEGKAAARKKEQDRTDLDKILVQLVDEVTLFLAKARMKAEQSVFTKHPHLYLTRGPGRPGGGECRHWAGSPQEELERQKKNFESHPLRYLSSGAAGAHSYYAQKAAIEKGVPEYQNFDPLCPQCEESVAEKVFLAVQKAMGKDVEKSIPHPSVSGALPSPHRRRGDENSELPLSVDTERGPGGEVSNREVSLKGPGP